MSAAAALPRLRTFRHETEIAASLDEAFDFFSRPANLVALTPRWLRLEIESGPERVTGAGAVLALRMRPFGLAVRWDAEIVAHDPPHSFEDVQRRGPWRHFRHRHAFVATGRGTVRVLDEVEYAPPGPRRLEPLATFFARLSLIRLFAYRERALRRRFRWPPCRSPGGHRVRLRLSAPAVATTADGGRRPPGRR